MGSRSGPVYFNLFMTEIKCSYDKLYTCVIEYSVLNLGHFVICDNFHR